MNRAFRSLAAALSLFAMSLAVGEAVWAATCAPMVPDAAASAVDEHAPAEAPCCAAPAGDDGRADEAPDCPLSAIATFGSCVSSAVPPTPATALPPSPEGAEAVSAAGDPSLLLLASSVFHPPRA